MDPMSVCGTCGRRSVDCVGHCGHIDLEAPVFHIGFFPAVVRICRTICKKCSRALLTPQEIEYYTRQLQGAMEPLKRMALVNHIQTEAYKTRICLCCGSINGTVRRVRPVRIVHEKYDVELRQGDHTNEDVGRSALEPLLDKAQQFEHDIKDRLPYFHEFLDPVRVRVLFTAIPPSQYLLLGILPGNHPVDLLVNTLLLPPLSVRPRCKLGLNIRDDDLTTQYSDILTISESLKDGTADIHKYVENWEMLQSRYARLLDSAMPGFTQSWQSNDFKSYAQRLKGKTGRFRGNLSGKRVDFSGRSVISPDPNLAVDELAVPLRVARVLTYPQRVFQHNIEQLRRLVRNGPNVHPGAVKVYLSKEKSYKLLQSTRDRELLASKLSIGDVVERHVMNGDMILFNRQPSLHRISMMAHRARVLPFRTFRFNVCCCAPYNADFDGDEMNVHVVQTEEARAEAKELMLTSNNIINAKNGEPIIACIQDLLTAMYLVTSREVFFDRSQFTAAVSHWLRPAGYELPTPALLKPVELWTGKQLVQLLLCASPEANVLLSFEAKAKVYAGKDKHLHPSEGFVSLLDSHLISGRLDKKLLGGGAKDGLFARLHAAAGGAYTAQCMSDVGRFASRYLQNYGFSLGLGDVAPTPSLNERKMEVLHASFARCEALIAEAATGRLSPLPGLTIKQTLEAKLNSELSTVRDECGQAAVNTLDPIVNAPLIMVNSGSKGSALNTAQMMACVGQQTVNGKRIGNAFDHRSLPHFAQYAESPEARGFVANSFYSGLTPTEFFFHSMAGREGLVDTAVKTAETGYIYRRLSKAMENLQVLYDQSVRHPDGSVVQLRYGEDGLDPLVMEGAEGSPLNLEQEWLTVRAAVARHTDERRQQRVRLAAGSPKQRKHGMTEDDFTQYYNVSLQPGEVLEFLQACLNGDKSVFERIRTFVDMEKEEETVYRQLLKEEGRLTRSHAPPPMWEN
ncbi:DNA-directed RNA polymerase III subunit RPC1 [Angomonas deanei]|uniref:DNA-directed RNA polymerase subunit n=1 Tax=Angomonas deanei TaxID=59799 RepID=A0A7G2CD49_9TRYP|nr:DNA-directed RNA polymerase III subunit RPC1 [Angomonas deanei]CAD2216941.1 RNA polymerase Rpb1, domain 1/RNA polymerase Rpb1, domain 2/RNA polymerase Rpb1, domain 3/RNA polymerase Rpb1, domain 4/RNA polymerase Rpb1, domain 5, putative [Angomonas deanei]|eukprot:EPY27397.1 DNA-directed RNA polymerase III subunit RPC1 [Angomonas deanei]